MSPIIFTKIKFLLLLLAITELYWKPVICVRSFDIRFTRANCTVMSKSHVAFFECPIIELPRNRGNFISGRIQFSQIIDKSTIDLMLSLPRGKNNPMNVLKFRFDGCRTSASKSNNPLINTITKMLLQAGNFPKSCPVKANFTYAVDHFAISPDYFSSYTPEMNFTFKLNMFTEKTHLFSACLQAALTKKK